MLLQKNKNGVFSYLIWGMLFFLEIVGPATSYSFSQDEWTQQYQRIVLLVAGNKLQEALPLALDSLTKANEHFGKSDRLTTTSATLAIRIYTSLGEI